MPAATMKTQPAKRKHRDPVYPEAAKNARAQGTVVLELTVNRAGDVIAVRVVSSVPLLDAAADRSRPRVEVRALGLRFSSRVSCLRSLHARRAQGRRRPRPRRRPCVPGGEGLLGEHLPPRRPDAPKPGAPPPRGSLSSDSPRGSSRVSSLRRHVDRRALSLPSRRSKRRPREDPSPGSGGNPRFRSPRAEAAADERGSRPRPSATRFP